MVRYESLILAIPEITQDEINTLEKELDRITQKAKGSIIAFDRWGKFRLAYPVRKNDYGVYFLARFEVPIEAAINEDIKALFAIKLNNIVMRNLFACLDSQASSDYQRPKSLEESPATRDVSTFLKENKMEGLLSSVQAQEAALEKKSAAVATEQKTTQEPDDKDPIATDDTSEVSDDKKN